MMYSGRLACSIGIQKNRRSSNDIAIGVYVNAIFPITSNILWQIRSIADIQFDQNITKVWTLAWNLLHTKIVPVTASEL